MAQFKIKPASTPRSARDLVAQSLVCDAMLPWLCTDQSHAILSRYHAIGFDFISITVSSDDEACDPAAYALRAMARLRRLMAERPDKYVLAGTGAEVRAARLARRLAINFNFQGTLAFGKSTELVWAYRELGLRQVLLAYNQANFVCDGCSETREGGLTKVGIRLVKALNDARITVDGTHCSPRATFDAMELSTRPFIFSHSNCHSVYPHYRNITDEQIKACAATGGFIGINGLNLFLGDETGGSEAIFRHIDHVATLVGYQHVGLGLDYVQFEEPIDAYYAVNQDTWPDNPYNGRPMRGIRSAQPEQIVEVTELMLRHGYTSEMIEAILGGNYLRVSETIWGGGGSA
ncbi:MAG: membrane dipeptidase [Methylobacterium sp.]|nr:membrane dipeptidase [Methylobacterium sp.]